MNPLVIELSAKEFAIVISCICWTMPHWDPISNHCCANTLSDLVPRSIFPNSAMPCFHSLDLLQVQETLTYADSQRLPCERKATSRVSPRACAGCLMERAARFFRHVASLPGGGTGVMTACCRPLFAGSEHALSSCFNERLIMFVFLVCFGYHLAILEDNDQTLSCRESIANQTAWWDPTVRDKTAQTTPKSVAAISVTQRGPKQRGAKANASKRKQKQTSHYDHATMHRKNPFPETLFHCKPTARHLLRTLPRTLLGSTLQSLVRILLISVGGLSHDPLGVHPRENTPTYTHTHTELEFTSVRQSSRSVQTGAPYLPRPATSGGRMLQAWTRPNPHLWCCNVPKLLGNPSFWMPLHY